jgi:hypothetical protein
VSKAASSRELRGFVLTGESPDRLIGPGRADEILASCLLPFAATLLAAEIPTRQYLTYPSPPSTRWTRLMVDMMSRAGHRIAPRTAAEHQGLHYLYHGYCR